MGHLFKATIEVAMKLDREVHFKSANPDVNISFPRHETDVDKDAEIGLSAGKEPIFCQRA